MDIKQFYNPVLQRVRISWSQFVEVRGSENQLPAGAPMTRPGIEHRSPGPVANTLPTQPMSRLRNSTYSLMFKSTVYSKHEHPCSTKLNARDELFLKGVTCKFPWMHPSQRNLLAELLPNTLSLDNMLSKDFLPMYPNHSCHINLEFLSSAVLKSC